MDKKHEKLIDSLIEQKKTLWAAMIVLTGGLVGLALSFSLPLFSFLNVVKVFFLILGLLLDYLFFEGLSSITNKLDDNLK